MIGKLFIRNNTKWHIILLHAIEILREVRSKKLLKGSWVTLPCLRFLRTWSPIWTIRYQFCIRYFLILSEDVLKFILKKEENIFSLC